MGNKGAFINSRQPKNKHFENEAILQKVLSKYLNIESAEDFEPEDLTLLKKRKKIIKKLWYQTETFSLTQ